MPQTCWQFFEFPIALDAMTLVASPKNMWLQAVTFRHENHVGTGGSGKITEWKQVNSAWRGEPMDSFGAGSDSGNVELLRGSGCWRG